MDETSGQQGEVQRPQVRLETELVQLLATARAVLRDLAPTVHPDLDAEGYRLLITVSRYVERAGGGVRGTELVDVLGVHKSSVSRGVAHLEELGLIERTSDPRDARAHLIVLTGRGVSGLEAARRHRRQQIEQRLVDWSPEDVASATDVLRRLNAAFS